MLKTLALAGATAALVLGSIAVAQTASTGGDYNNNNGAANNNMSANPADQNGTNAAATTPDNGTNTAGERG